MLPDQQNPQTVDSLYQHQQQVQGYCQQPTHSAVNTGGKFLSPPASTFPCTVVKMCLIVIVCQVLCSVHPLNPSSKYEQQL